MSSNKEANVGKLFVMKQKLYTVDHLRSEWNAPT